MDPIYLTGNGPSEPYDQIEIDEDDDEEDELDSDLEDHEPPPPVKKVPDGEEIEPDPEDEEDLVGPGQSTANGRRKPLRKSGERVPGYSLLPQTRIENILRADGV